MKNIFFIIALALICCSKPARVIQFTNENMNFSDYQTYRLINYKSDDKSFSEKGMAVFNAIEAAIDTNMVRKNYAYADEPDMIVRYEIISTIETQSNSTWNNRNDPYFYNNYYYDPNRFYDNSRKFTEGVLLIEFRDKKKKKLIWQGSQDFKLSKKETPIQTAQNSVNYIFETYRYTAGSNELIPVESKKKKS